MQPPNRILSFALFPELQIHLFNVLHISTSKSSQHLKLNTVERSIIHIHPFSYSNSHFSSRLVSKAVMSHLPSTELLTLKLSIGGEAKRAPIVTFILGPQGLHSFAPASTQKHSPQLLHMLTCMFPPMMG